MTKNIKIAVALAIFAVVAIAVTYGTITLNKIVDLQSRIDSIETTAELTESSDLIIQDKGNTCLANAYEVYSNEWDRQCFSIGERENCILPLINRIDLTMEFNDDRIICLISIN